MRLFLLVLTAISSGNEALYIKNLSSEEGSIFAGVENEKPDSVVLPLKTEEMNTEELRDFKENVLISNTTSADLKLINVSDEYDHENELTATSKIDSVILSTTTEEPLIEHSNYEKIIPDPKNIEIHEIIPVDYQKEFSISKLEDDIRTEVKEETLLEENFNSPIVKALEDIPDTEIRKELTTDILAANHIDDIKDENGKKLNQDDSVKEAEITTNEETNESNDTHIETNRSDLILNEPLVEGKSENIEEDKVDLNKDENISRAQNERSLLSFFGNIASKLSSSNDKVVVTEEIKAEKTTYEPFTELPVTVKVDGAEYFHNKKEQIITEKYMEDDDQYIEPTTGKPLINGIDIVKKIVGYFKQPTQEELFTTIKPKGNPEYHDKEAMDFKDNSLETTTYNAEPTTMYISSSDLDEKIKRSLGYLFSRFTASKITTTEIPHITTTEKIFEVYEKDDDTTNKVVIPHDSYEPYKYYETTSELELITEKHKIIHSSEYKTSPATFIYELNKDVEITTENYKEFNHHEPESITEKYDHLENGEYDANPTTQFYGWDKHQDITTESKETKFNTQKSYDYETSFEPEIITEKHYTEIPAVIPHVNGIVEKDTEPIIKEFKPNLHYEYDSHTMTEAELITEEQHSTHSNEYKTTPPVIPDTYYETYEKLGTTIETETIPPHIYQSYTHHDVNPEKQFIAEPHNTEISPIYAETTNHEVYNKDQEEMIENTQHNFHVTHIQHEAIPDPESISEKSHDITQEYDKPTHTTTGAYLYESDKYHETITPEVRPIFLNEDIYDTQKEHFTIPEPHTEYYETYHENTYKNPEGTPKINSVPTYTHKSSKEYETTTNFNYDDKTDSWTESNGLGVYQKEVTDQYIDNTSKTHKYDEHNFEATSKPLYMTLKNNDHIHESQHLYDSTTDQSYLTVFKTEHIPPKISTSDNLHHTEPYGGEKGSETTLSSLHFDDHDKSQHNKVDTIKDIINHFYTTESETNPPHKEYEEVTDQFIYTASKINLYDEYNYETTSKPIYTTLKNNEHIDESQHHYDTTTDHSYVTAFKAESISPKRSTSDNLHVPNESYQALDYIPYGSETELETTLTSLNIDDHDKSQHNKIDSIKKNTNHFYTTESESNPSTVAYNYELYKTKDSTDTIAHANENYHRTGDGHEGKTNKPTYLETEQQSNKYFEEPELNEIEFDEFYGESRKFDLNDDETSRSFVTSYLYVTPSETTTTTTTPSHESYKIHESVAEQFHEEKHFSHQVTDPAITASIYNHDKHKVYDVPETTTYEYSVYDAYKTNSPHNEKIITETEPPSTNSHKHDSEHSYGISRHNSEITTFNYDHESLKENEMHFEESLIKDHTQTTSELYDPIIKLDRTEIPEHIISSHREGAQKLHDEVKSIFNYFLKNSSTEKPPPISITTTELYNNHDTYETVTDNYDSKNQRPINDHSLEFHTSTYPYATLVTDYPFDKLTTTEYYSHNQEITPKITTHLFKNHHQLIPEDVHLTDKLFTSGSDIKYKTEPTEAIHHVTHKQKGSHLDSSNWNEKEHNTNSYTTLPTFAYSNHKTTAPAYEQHETKEISHTSHNHKQLISKDSIITLQVHKDHKLHKNENHDEKTTHVSKNDKTIHETTTAQIEYDTHEKSQKHHQDASQLDHDYTSHKNQNDDGKTIHFPQADKKIHDTTTVRIEYDVHVKPQKQHEATSQLHHDHKSHKNQDHNAKTIHFPKNHKAIHDTTTVRVEYDAYKKSEKHHEAIPQVDHDHKSHKNKNHEEKLAHVLEKDKIIHDATTVRINYDAHEKSQKHHEDASQVHYDQKSHKNHNHDEKTTHVSKNDKTIHDTTTVEIKYDAHEKSQEHSKATSQENYVHTSHKNQNHDDKPTHTTQNHKTLHDTTTVGIKYDKHEKSQKHHQDASQLDHDYTSHKNHDDGKTIHFPQADKKIHDTTTVRIEYDAHVKPQKQHEATSQLHHDHKSHKNQDHDEKTLHFPKNVKAIHDTTTVRVEYDAHEKSEKHHEAIPQVDHHHKSHKNKNHEEKLTHVLEKDKIIHDATTVRIKYDAHEKSQKQHEVASQVHYDQKSHKNQNHDEKTTHVSKNHKTIHDTTTVGIKYDAHEKSDKHHEAISQVDHDHKPDDNQNHEVKIEHVPENDKIIYDTSTVRIKYDAHEKSQEHHETTSQVHHDHKLHKNHNHDEKITHVPQTQKTIHDTNTLEIKYDAHEKYEKQREDTSQVDYGHKGHTNQNHEEKTTHVPQKGNIIHDTTSVRIKYDAQETSPKHHEATSQVYHDYESHSIQNHEEKLTHVPQTDKMIYDEKSQEHHEAKSQVNHEYKSHKNQTHNDKPTHVPQNHKTIHDVTTERIKYDAHEKSEKHHEDLPQVHHDHKSHKNKDHDEETTHVPQIHKIIYDTTTTQIEYDAHENSQKQHEGITQVNHDHKLHKNQNHYEKTTHVPKNDKTIHDTTTVRNEYDAHEKSEKYNEATSHIHPDHKPHKNQNLEEKITQKIENLDHRKGVHTIFSLDRKESKYGSHHNSELDDHKASLDHGKHIETTPYVHSYTSKPSLMYGKDHHNQDLDNHKAQFEDFQMTHTIGYDNSEKHHETTPSVSQHYTTEPTIIYDTYNYKITTSPPMDHKKSEKPKTIDDNGNAYKSENPQDTKPSYLYTITSRNSYAENNLDEKHKIPSIASNIPYSTYDHKTTTPNIMHYENDSHHETTEYSTDKSHYTEYLPTTISDYDKTERNYEKSEISKITTITPIFDHDHDSKDHKTEVTTAHDYTTRSPYSQTEKISTPKNILALLNKHAKSAIAEFRKNVSPKKKIFRNKIIIDAKKEDELISAVGKIIEPTIKEFGLHDTEEITKAISIQLIRHATRDMGIKFTEKQNYPTIEFIYVDPSKPDNKYQTIELKEILKGKKDDDDDDDDDFGEDDDESFEEEKDKKEKYSKKVFKVFFHRNQEERDAFIHSLEEKNSNPHGRSFEDGPELFPIPLPDISLGDNEKLYGVIIENNLHAVTKKAGVDSVVDLFTTTEHIFEETTEHLYQSTENFNEKFETTETSLADVQSRTIEFEEGSGSGAYLVDAIVEAAELTTELSRQVNSFRETFSENRSLLTSSSKITALKSPREVVESSMGGDDQGVLGILLLSLGILFTVLGAISFYIIKVRRQQGTLEFEPVDQTEMEEKSRISSSC